MSKVSEYLKQLNGGGNAVDIIWCTLRYGASPNNYREFGFEKLNHSQRNTYVTNRLSRQMIKRFNDQSKIDVFENKVMFAQRFTEFFGRDWIASDGITLEELIRFSDDVGGKYIYKPVGNAQGLGIKVYENADAKKVFKEIKDSPPAILEGWITQHESLDTVYNDAINCLRIITVYKDCQTYFLAGGMTWGNGQKIANASASGIVSPVNFENGVLEKPAADFSGYVYSNHPISGYPLVGFQLPFWKETIEMLKEAAKVVPEVGYIGWDVAITPNGPIIIEGNTTPGYKYYQIPAHMDNGIGNKAVYANCLKSK